MAVLVKNNMLISVSARELNGPPPFDVIAAPLIAPFLTVNPTNAAGAVTINTRVILLPLTLKSGLNNVPTSR